MDLYPTHIAFLNAMLPPKYKFDPVTKSDSRQVIPILEALRSRKSGFHIRFQNKIPEKRANPEKSLAVDEGYNPGTKKSEEFRKLMKILTEIKNHHLATPFLCPVDKK